MTKEQVADRFDVAVEDVYWCEICEEFTIDGEDGYPLCQCA